MRESRASNTDCVKMRSRYVNTITTIITFSFHPRQNYWLLGSLRDCKSLISDFDSCRYRGSVRRADTFKRAEFYNSRRVRSAIAAKEGKSIFQTHGTLRYPVLRAKHAWQGDVARCRSRFGNSANCRNRTLQVLFIIRHAMPWHNHLAISTSDRSFFRPATRSLR
jgi:hypothetical protein